MDKLRAAFLAATLMGGLSILSACDGGNEGPLERAGETTDDAVEDAGDAVEDATE